MPGARRNWWKHPRVMPRSTHDESRSASHGAADRQYAAFAHSDLDGSVDSPLCRARMAAESQRIAERLAALEHEGTRPDLIVEMRTALISVRAHLCGAS